jgi:hypothetical protein
MRCLQDPDAESGAGVQIEPSVTPSIGYGAAVVNVKGFAQANSGKAMDEVLVVPAQATHFVQYLNQPLHGARGRAGFAECRTLVRGQPASAWRFASESSLVARVQLQRVAGPLSLMASPVRTFAPFSSR